MAAKSDDTTSEKPIEGDGMVSVELNPSGGVDRLGEGEPLLIAGAKRLFTRAEADLLLALKNPHGAPICRIANEEQPS